MLALGGCFHIFAILVVDDQNYSSLPHEKNVFQLILNCDAIWHSLRQQVFIRKLQRCIPLFDCIRDLLERGLETRDSTFHGFAS